MRHRRSAVATGTIVFPAAAVLGLLFPTAWSAPAALAVEASAQAAPIACSAERPTAVPGSSVALQTFVPPVGAAESGGAPQYAWSVTGGRVDGRGSSAVWDFTKTSAGTYTATVRVEDKAGSTADCSIQVIVGSSGRGVGRESGRSLLVKGQREQPGYGLYSYLLFGAPPEGEAQERYAQAVSAYWQQMPAIKDLEAYLPPAELNVTYLPVAMPPGSAASAQWALEHYDYARARALLHTLAGDHRGGPYIVSAWKPIAVSTALDGPYLYQDLSPVPPHLVASWVKEFLNQAAQEHPWQVRKGQQLALRMRTTVGVAAMGVEPVLKSLHELIAWVPKLQ